MLQRVAAWKTELAALVSRRANSELRWGERLLHGLDEQLAQHDEPGGRGVQRGVGRRRQRRHQHDVGTLQRAVWVTRAIARGAV